MAFSSATDRFNEVTSFEESKAGVKGLSDAGITTIPRIFVHPPETLSSLNSSVSLSIPVIDLSGLSSPDGRAAIVEQLKSAASKWGFFQVINHGVPETALDGILNAVRAFHEQPEEARRVHYTRDYKKEFKYMTNMDLHRSKAASWNDHIGVHMTPPPPGAAMPEICRREVFEWDARVARVGEELMELLFEGLLGPGRCRELAACVDDRTFTGICYPYCPQPELTVGLTPHTDPHVITVVHQNHVPGLQVKHAHHWVDINPLPGGFIVNVGDITQIMSNDKYISVKHRVRANTSSEPRISAIVYFNIGNREKEAGPLPELVSPENPPKYHNFTIGQYTETFYSKQLDINTALQTFKINNFH